MQSAILLVVLVVLGVLVWNRYEERRHRARELARRAYEEDAYKNGVTAARARCLHPFTRLSQTGIPGMVTMTKKWCSVCGVELPHPELVKGWFGDYWR